MNFPRFFANKQTPPGGYHGLMLQKKIVQNGYKIVTMKEGLETTHNDHTFVSYCEFQREGFARATLWPLSIIVLQTLQLYSSVSSVKIMYHI